MITKILNNIKQFFTLKQLTILPLVFLTLSLFILNKILHVEWYISIFATLICAIFVPKFINPKWESKLLKFSLFQKYLYLMLFFESMFLSSFMARFTTGVYLFIIFEFLHQNENVLTVGIVLFISFLFLLYFRLRSQIFSINELAYDVINEISPSELNNHFLKMLGVQLNLNSKHKYYLIGFPKRDMHSTFRTILGISRSGAGPLLGAGISYSAYTSDQSAAKNNQLAKDQIDRLITTHDTLLNHYYQNFSGEKYTMEHKKIKHLMNESAQHIEMLSTYVKTRDIVGIRIFTTPVPADCHYQSLKQDTVESLALLRSKIDSFSTGIQKTSFYELTELIAKSVFV